jgi:hypothetical protein
MLQVFRKFSQGIIIGGCALTSFITLSYIINDAHRLEKKQIIAKYDAKIAELEKRMLK